MEIVSDSGTVEIRDITGKVTRIAFNGALVVGEEPADEHRTRIAAFVNPHSERGQYWYDNWNEFEIMECNWEIDELESDTNEQLVTLRTRLKELHLRYENDPRTGWSPDAETLTT